eukprot:gnl/Spiro4/1315_TR704_c0_g1_i3.p1 gnl/Spiro4/1315_TR704_c0_g1~~gnl/Spiro4/1315_TR704_c0_g1_i3.p1  ORF type:complete len:895 (-),score=267.56 gnl/Spiro4/1315_TR704_c0_g1_i3:53-2707(-)
MRPFLLAILLFFCLCALCLAVGGKRRRSEAAALDDAINESYAAALRAFGPLDSELEAVVDAVLSQELLEDEPKSEKEKVKAEQEREEAKVRLLRFLIVASGWAAIDSLDNLVAELAKHGHSLAIDSKGATLSDFLLYLQLKGHFRDVAVPEQQQQQVSSEDSHSKKWSLLAFDRKELHPLYWYPDVEVELTGKHTLLLDSMMLRRLRDVPSFRDNVAAPSNDFTFVVPLGYEVLNMFTTNSVRRVASQLHDLLRKHRDFELPKQELAWMCDVLKAFTLDQLPKIKGYSWKTEFVVPSARLDFLLSLDEDDNEENNKKVQQFFALGSTELMNEYLVKNFRGSVPLEKSQWQTIFDMYDVDPDVATQIARTLSPGPESGGGFHSFEMLGAYSRTIFSELESLQETTETATKRDESAEESILSQTNKDEAEQQQHKQTLKFLVPVPQKSFGVATMIFFMNHPDLSTQHIVKSPGNIARNCAVALNGGVGHDDSILIGNCQKWKSHCSDKSHTMCVIVDDFAGSGSSLLSMYDFAKSKDGSRVVVAPLVQTVTAQEFFKTTGVPAATGLQLSPAPPYKSWMGGHGFSKGTYFVTFPYMAPDNNCGFMGYIVAPLLLFNGLGAKTLTIGAPPNFMNYLGLRHFAPFVNEAALGSVIPDSQLSTSLCPDGRFPVQIQYDCSVSDIDFPSFRSAGLWSWVLDEDFYLIFGSAVSNPLQLGISPCQLATDGPSEKTVFLSGQLEIPNDKHSGARVFLHPLSDTQTENLQKSGLLLHQSSNSNSKDFSSPSLSLIHPAPTTTSITQARIGEFVRSAFATIIREITPFTHVRLSSSSLIRAPSPLDFEDACERGNARIILEMRGERSSSKEASIELLEVDVCGGDVIGAHPCLE